MSEYRATVEWQLQGEFKYTSYSRAHAIDFGHGVQLPGNAGRGNVPATVQWTPGADPEQQFVASLSSCHMLTFLWLAARAGYLVESYRDEAVGLMAENGQGRLAMTRVTLGPRVVFGGEHKPTYDELAQLHHQAHEECFIANSVNTVVTTEIAL